MHKFPKFTLLNFPVFVKDLPEKFIKDEYLGLPELPGRNTNICTRRLHISHHNRSRANIQSCQMLTPLLTANPILVGKNPSQAIIIMVDSNLQRERVLPSEKAFAYQMKFYIPWKMP